MKYSGPTLNDTAPLGRTCTLGITSNVQPPASFAEYEADASKLTGRRRSLNTSAHAFHAAGVAASGPPRVSRPPRAWRTTTWLLCEPQLWERFRTVTRLAAFGWLRGCTFR